MMIVNFICRVSGIAGISVRLKMRLRSILQIVGLVREDRLSAPLTGVYSEKEKHFVTVSRIDKFAEEALSTHREGEIILSGKTSLGFTGFENQDGITALSFGFPYREAPKSYIRKLTLAPAVEAFQFLKRGRLFC